MLGLDNPIHLLIIGVVLLLLFGAKRLPEMGHSLGHGLRGFKESLTGDRAADAAPTTTHLRAAEPTPLPVEHRAEQGAPGSTQPAA